MKKTVLLTEMFYDVCTPIEKKKFEMLYAKNNKGSATVFALRTIKVYWDLHIAKKETISSSPVPENSLKINSGGISWFVERS